jgi:thiosulfate/3-mercaptopyruvate sulfurtransferase
LGFYRNQDDTMRPAEQILALWKQQGIDPSRHLSFMCGSGWRAAEVLHYATVIGVPDAALYSDGWIGWSNNPDNPVVTGDPDGAASPE